MNFLSNFFDGSRGILSSDNKTIAVIILCLFIIILSIIIAVLFGKK